MRRCVLTFFGSALETIRTFDPETQRTLTQQKYAALVPMSEVVLTPEAISTFRRAYTRQFGGDTASDPLYAAISAGQRFAGMEHWLPFFYGEMGNLRDFTGEAAWILDDQVSQSIAERMAQIADYYEARFEALSEPQTGGAPYKPLPPDMLYDLQTDTTEWLGTKLYQVTPFQTLERPDAEITSLDGQLVANFSQERQAKDTNVFEAVLQRIRAKQAEGKRAIIACWSEGTRDRMAQVLKDHEHENLKLIQFWQQAEDLNKNAIG